MTSNLPQYIDITTSTRSSIEAFFETNFFSQTFVLVDENTKIYCLPKIISALPSEFTLIEIESGESNKNLATCEKIWGVMTDNNADRKSLLINLGGGVITDMGGFCAATYKRGIDFVNIPTTLLAQVDASIGGKLGIDFKGFKNHIGLFQIPSKVIVDPNFLETLPFEELRSGFAEIIKHNLIADNVQYKKLRDQSIDQLDWLSWIESSLNIKNRIVEADPREKGERKLLNFGHTIGHAIESFYLNSKNHLRHGEAIAIGMITEAYLSNLKTGLSDNDLDEITRYLNEIYEPGEINMKDIEAIVELALQDKKNDGLRIKCVLLNQIGGAEYDVEINADDIRSAIEYHNSQIK